MQAHEIKISTIQISIFNTLMYIYIYNKHQETTT